MSDYINYIDDNLIARADLEFNKGNYHLSSILYSSALDKLRGYQGDRMHPIMLAQSLARKLKQSDRLLEK